MTSENTADEEAEDEPLRIPKLYGKPEALKRTLHLRKTQKNTFIPVENVDGVQRDFLRSGNDGKFETFKCVLCVRRLVFDTENTNWQFIREIGEHSCLH